MAERSIERAGLRVARLTQFGRGENAGELPGAGLGAHQRMAELQAEVKVLAAPAAPADGRPSHEAVGLVEEEQDRAGWQRLISGDTGTGAVQIDASYGNAAPINIDGCGETDTCAGIGATINKRRRIAFHAQTRQS